MEAGETIGLALTGLFGIVSTVGVVYQVLDIRQRSRENGPPSDVLQLVGPVPIAAVAMPETGLLRPQHSDTFVAHQNPSSPAVPIMVSGANIPTEQSVQAQSPPPPAMIVRVRQLILSLSVLTVIGFGLLMYVGAVSTPAEGTDAKETTASESLLYGTIATMVFALPFVAVQTLLSIKIGARRTWARIAAIVVMLAQAGLCGCAGLLGASAGLTPADDGFVGAPALANLAVGMAGILIAPVATAASVLLLLPSSQAYFAQATS